MTETEISIVVDGKAPIERMGSIIKSIKMDDIDIDRIEITFSLVEENENENDDEVLAKNVIDAASDDNKVEELSAKQQTEKEEKEEAKSNRGPNEYHVGKTRKAEVVGEHTQSASVLNTILETENEWIDSRGIVEEVDDPKINMKKVTGLLSGLNERGLVKRKERPDFKSHVESGPKYQYNITERGKKALERGKKSS